MFTQLQQNLNTCSNTNNNDNIQNEEKSFGYDIVTSITPDSEITYQGYEAIYAKFLSKSYTYIQGPKDSPYKRINEGLRVAKNEGWKLHISIDDSDLGMNLPNAWGIIINQIIKHKVYYSKVIRNEFRSALNLNEAQRGKEVTIYCFKENRPTTLWVVFITELTSALTAANIRPGPLPGSDKAIIGSNYFSYRNDNTKDSTPDPFLDIQIKVNSQLERVIVNNSNSNTSYITVNKG